MPLERKYADTGVLVTGGAGLLEETIAYFKHSLELA
jgi:hypothetical protein